MNLQILQNQLLRLTVVPELGASIVGLELYYHGFWLPLLRPTAPAALVQRLSPETSSYLLAPYSNRIRDGRFHFAGKTYQLRPNWVDGQQTIHGEVHPRVWTAQRFDEHRLQCSFDSQSVQDINFPFSFAMNVQYTLKRTGLELFTSLQNTGHEPMPAGFGHHPYFMRHLGHSGDARLSFQAQRAPCCKVCANRSTICRGVRWWTTSCTRLRSRQFKLSELESRAREEGLGLRTWICVRSRPNDPQRSAIH